jgi:hypothetical protein
MLYKLSANRLELLLFMIKPVLVVEGMHSPGTDVAMMRSADEQVESVPS